MSDYTTGTGGGAEDGGAPKVTPENRVSILLKAVTVGIVLLCIPLWSHHVGNWWLLIGMPISWIAIACAAVPVPEALYFLCFCTGYWVRHGADIHQYTTFFFACAALSFVLWFLAESSRMGAVALRSFNLIGGVLEYVFGFFIGSALAANAYARGIESVRPERADMAMRNLKNGSVGLLVIALGYFGFKSAYGITLVAIWVGVIIVYYFLAWRVAKQARSGGRV